MVLEYLPAFTQYLWPSFVGNYSNTKERMGTLPVRRMRVGLEGLQAMAWFRRDLLLCHDQGIMRCYEWCFS